MRVIRDAPVPLPRPIPTPEPAGVRAGVWEGGAGGAASRSVSPPTKKQRKKLPGAAAALGAAPGWAPGPPPPFPIPTAGPERTKPGWAPPPAGLPGGDRERAGGEQGARGKRPQAQPGPALPTTHLESLERLAGRQARAAAGQEFGRKREGFYFPWSLKRGSEECEE